MSAKIILNVELRKRSILSLNTISFNLLNPAGRTKPGVYSASNADEYQKQRNNSVSGE
jgi:hypothetical protein